jgi:hypothetical protein
MLQNQHYNLMESITIISKSLHRYDTYMRDSARCGECQTIWQNLRDEREKDLAMLMDELNKHIKKGEITA